MTIMPSMEIELGWLPLPMTSRAAVEIQAGTSMGPWIDVLLFKIFGP